MKKYLIPMGLIIVLSLSACGGAASVSSTQVINEETSISASTETTVSDEVSIEASVSEEVIDAPIDDIEEQHEYIPVSIVESKAANLDYFYPMEDVEAWTAEDKAYITFFNGGDEYTLTFSDSGEPTDAVCTDDRTYLVSVCVGRGTGYYVEELQEYDGQTDMRTVMEVSDITNIIESRVKAEYTDMAVELCVDEGDRFYVNLDGVMGDSEGDFEKVSWSDMVDIDFVGGQPFVKVAMTVYLTDRPMPSFEAGITLTAPIIKDDNGKYSLGSILLSRDNDIYEAVDENYAKVVNINEVPVDVDHDEIMEKAVTKVCYLEGSSPVEKALYDGSAVIAIEVLADKYPYTLWRSNDISNCHAGNGQVFTTRVNDKDLIVVTDLSMFQGMLGYSYEVYMFNGGSIYPVDTMSVTGEFTGNPEGEDAKALSLFFKELDKWINDSSQLLIYSDMDSETPFVYATTGNVINPKAYYDNKKTIYGIN